MPEQPSSRNRIQPHELVNEMRQSFLDYSMSVIVRRALPDVRDGLKPVHRRILQTLYEEKLWPDQEHQKSASVVGTALAKYHPHGDSAVYDSMVRMAQPFSLAVPLVDGQGNFGSLDGDSAAAYRYTEARMSEAAREMLTDIEKDTVDFQSTFDDRNQEPVVLPARIPNLLLNGAEGIAVGMSTSIPPHNLQELAQAITTLCKNPEAPDEEVYGPIQGPDFPTGGLVLESKGIDKFMREGRGKMRMRARVHVEKGRGGRTMLVFTEIPFGVVKGNILEQINRNVKRSDRKNYRWAEPIRDLRDESGRQGIRLIVELKRGADPKPVLDGLYKKTTLAKTYGGRLLALVNQTPTYMNVREALEHWIDHRLEVIRRRSEHDLEKAEARAHILEGLLIAIDAIDTVVELIKRSRKRHTARKKIRKELDITKKQADAILDLRLAQLTGMDVTSLKEELREKRARIKEINKILDSEQRQREIIVEETEEMVELFGQPRRTQIVAQEQAEQVAKRAAQEFMKLEILKSGKVYAKLVGQSVGRRTQKKDPAFWKFSIKGGKRAVLFSDRGQAYRLYPEEVLERGASTPSLSSIVEGMQQDEQILWAASPEDFEQRGSVVFVKSSGKVKRTDLEEFQSPIAGGIIATGVADEADIVSIFPVEGEEELLLATAQGQAIRFPVSDLPTHGRSAKGVKGVDLQEGDRVVSARPVQGDQVVMITEKGWGKRMELARFSDQHRAGKGIILAKTNGDTGKVRWAFPVNPEEKLLLFQTGSAEKPFYFDITRLPFMGRNTRGEPIDGLPEDLNRWEARPFQQEE